MGDWYTNSQVEGRLEGYVEWLQTQKDSKDIRENKRYAIAFSDTDEMIGMVGMGLEENTNEVEVAYFMQEKNQHRGYASQAVQALVTWCFAVSDVPYLILTVDCANGPSCRLAEKCGFELFEKRTPIGHVQPNMESESYYYFRKYRTSKTEWITTDGENADFAALCEKLDQNLDELVGKKFQRSQYEQFNHRDSIRDVILAYQNGNPVACGGFKKYDEAHAELKRIFVDPSCRSLGLGEEMVRRLEKLAVQKGYSYCILETGAPLKAACHLYEKAGYQIIPNYGQYKDMPNSICMQRKIVDCTG